ncbi:ATP-dependent zinc protease [Halomonas pacifica]|uniref:ATP-dependent Zn protease n=1 Tax=Bisbaumannia pacifica TaxID=77098 RepID=A0A510X5H2_9GAMM|nr:ATP-dependent zinc protease [Halomonas pacifica]MBH8579058.1 ATP-dependent zinc protease [Halomonas pacifica]MDC8802186.1 ATP-dependent zinc protease [Halomonas pacifica]GEK46201.1 ATP-dependent Zn protease [Halomonas pacifica]
MTRWKGWAGGWGLLLAGLASAPTLADEAPVFGWVEKASLEPWGIEVKAKLDSGALTSSLDARDIERFTRDGERWVRFRLDLEDEATGEVISETLELPRYRRVRLRGAGGEDSRPVVLMDICLGGTIYEEQFSLRDRGDMLYPLLLGRRTIGHLGLLDVTETFLTDPECDADSPRVPHDPDEE